MKRLLYICLMVCSLSISSVLAKPVDELIDKLEQIKSYQANFKQMILDENQKVLSSTHGTLKIKRPGKFRWQSEKPDPVLVIADGEIVWHYDIELEQVVQRPQKETLGQSPASILAGDASALRESYQVKTLNEKACSNQADACFLLEPSEAASSFQIIKIGFQGNRLNTIEMQDALNQSIKTHFTSIQINQPLKASIFEFTPPEGVDVISGQL